MRIIAKPPVLICHHCGRDYAAAYWEAESYFVWDGLEPRPSPICCAHCHRDGTPAAVPVPIPPADLPPVQLYIVPKRCYCCGAEWEGHSFAGPVSGAPPLVGICDSCIAKQEVRTAELSSPRHEPPAPVTLRRPSRTAEYDDARYGA